MIENIEKEELETEINATSDIQEENEADKEIEDLKDKLLRAVAESENIRKRYEKQLEDTRSYAIFNFAKDLPISVMTNENNIVEIQGGSEKKVFTELQLNEMLDLAKESIQNLLVYQRQACNSI